MAGTHGGARPGAGRKSKAEKYEPQIVKAERHIADRLPFLLANLDELADGGYERTTRKFQPSALITTSQVLRDDSGRMMTDAEGEPIVEKVRAFPDLGPDEMVCVEMTTETAAPDRAANIYLVDRIMGKPTQAVDLTSNGETVTGLVPHLTDEELDARLAQLEKRKAAPALPRVP